MRKLFFVILLISRLSSFSQDCYECESGKYVIDTNETIDKIRNRYQFLTNIKESNFDYVFEHKIENGCNEPDEIITSTYYVNKEIGIISELIIGSGEGGYYSNSSTNKYYLNNRLIFEYIVKSGSSMNSSKDSYREEYRIYYDNCGQVIRKLHKKVTGDELLNGQTLEKLINTKSTTDITPLAK